MGNSSLEIQDFHENLDFPRYPKETSEALRGVWVNEINTSGLLGDWQLPKAASAHSSLLGDWQLPKAALAHSRQADMFFTPLVHTHCGGPW